MKLDREEVLRIATLARLALLSAVKSVLGRGLSILGVSAPEEM